MRSLFTCVAQDIKPSYRVHTPLAPFRAIALAHTLYRRV